MLGTRGRMAVQVPGKVGKVQVGVKAELLHKVHELVRKLELQVRLLELVVRNTLVPAGLHSGMSCLRVYLVSVNH